MEYKRLWIALAIVILVSFGVLGGVGYKIINSAPPIPGQVVSGNGRVLFDGNSIQDGQNVWQAGVGHRQYPNLGIPPWPKFGPGWATGS